MNISTFYLSKILNSTTALVFIAASSVPAFGMDVGLDKDSKGLVVLPVVVPVNAPQEEPKTLGSRVLSGITAAYNTAGAAVQKVQVTISDTTTYVASTRVGQATAHYAEKARETIEVTGNTAAESAKAAREACTPKIQQTKDFLDGVDTYRAALDDIITNGVDMYTPTKNGAIAASQQLTEAFHSSNTSSSTTASRQAIAGAENVKESDTTLSKIGQIFKNPLMHSVLEGIIEESVPRVQNLIYNLILKYGAEGGAQIAEKMGLVQRIAHTAVRTANPLLAQIEDSIKAFDKHMMNGALEGLGYSLNPALYLMQALKLAELDGVVGAKLNAAGAAIGQKLIKSGVIQSVASSLDFQLQNTQKLLEDAKEPLTALHGVAGVGGLLAYPLKMTQTTKGYASALNTTWYIDRDLDDLVNHLESTTANVQGSISKLKNDTVLEGIVSASIDRSVKAAVKDINDSFGDGFKGAAGKALTDYVIFGTTDYQQPQTTALQSTTAVVSTINGSAKQYWGRVKNWFNTNIKVPFAAGCAVAAQPLNNVVGGHFGKVASSYVAEAVTEAPVKEKALQALNTVMTPTDMSSEIQKDILGSKELFKGMGETLTNMFFDNLDKSTQSYRQTLGLPAFSEWSKKRDELTVWQKGTRTGLWALGRIAYGGYNIAQGTINLVKNPSDVIGAMTYPLSPHQF